VDLYSASSWTHLPRRSGVARVLKGSHSFICTPRVYPLMELASRLIYARAHFEKPQNGRFPSKIALRLKKVCYKVTLCENCERQYCKAFIVLSIRAIWLVGTSPYTWKFGGYWPTHLQNVDFQSIFARSASAVTPSKKSSINTNRKSTTRRRLPMSLRWIVRCP